MALPQRTHHLSYSNFVIMWVIFTRSKTGLGVQRSPTHLHHQYIEGICRNLMQDNPVLLTKPESPIVVFVQVLSQTLHRKL